MDKYWVNDADGEYTDKDYAIKQVKQLQGDLRDAMSGLTKSIMDFQKIICGLTVGHTWWLECMETRIYPSCDPPGVYKFRCRTCDELVLLRACDKKTWPKQFKAVL